MFGMLEVMSVPGSGIFSTYEDLMLELSRQMERDGYRVVKARSHRRKGGSGEPDGEQNDVVRCDLVCARGGRPYKCMATKHKTTTKKTDCPWKAKAVNRKSVGGWVLTIMCDEHNHEPGTPEPHAARGPPVSQGQSREAGESRALHVAGVSDLTLRLNGETFQQLKSEYRQLSHADRLNTLAHLQTKLAAMYAVQNEEQQRQHRSDDRGAELARQGQRARKQGQRSQAERPGSVGPSGGRTPPDNMDDAFS